MNKKQKIIASAVFVLFMIGIIWFVVATMMPEDEVVDTGIELKTPKIDESKLDSVSKLDIYEDELGDGSLFSNEIIDESQKESDSWKDNIIKLDLFNRDKESTEEEVVAEEGFGGTMGQEINPELLALMKEQEEIMARQQAALAQQKEQVQQQNNYSPINEPYPDQVEMEVEEVPLTVGKMREKNGSFTDYFQGAGGFSAKANRLDLIPAEVVDQGYLIINSTLAIRTKRTLRIENPRLVIPKGAILYGKTSFGGLDRMNVEIVSYKYRDKLYPVELVVYDFDGREGVHLGNLPWPKIPAKVSKEVFDYIKQRGSQAGQFGGAAEIDLGQAKDVALLSALKEITEELFERKRVFMPRKYNIWIHVPKNEDL